MWVLCMTSANEPDDRSDSKRLDDWLTGIAAGDTAALEGLYHATRTRVYAFALSILRHGPDAEDVLHDCYVNIWSAAGGYRSHGKPLAWILTVTRNLCLMRLRERIRTDALPEDEREPVLPEDPQLTADDRLVLTACLEGLNEKDRRIVVLHAVSGLKHREIAELLELPLPTVLSRYHRALKKLQALLKKGEQPV